MDNSDISDISDVSDVSDVSDNDDIDNDNNEETLNDNKKIKIKDTNKLVYDQLENQPKETPPFLTKFEKARIIGLRMQQIASGSPILVNTEGVKTLREVVEKEIIERKIPLIIARILPNNKREYWKIDEFQVL